MIQKGLIHCKTKQPTNQSTNTAIAITFINFQKLWFTNNISIKEILRALYGLVWVEIHDGDTMS